MLSEEATYRNQFKSSIRTSSFAQLMERMRTERLRQPTRAAAASVRANELEPSQRRSEGLLLGASDAVSLGARLD